MIHKHFYLILFGVAGVIVLIVMAKSGAGTAVASPAPLPSFTPPWQLSTIGGGIGPWPLTVSPYPGQADQSGIGDTTYKTVTGWRGPIS
jgi:hypothetical protein